MVRPAGSRLFCGSQTGQAGPPPQTRGPYAPRKGDSAARARMVPDHRTAGGTRARPGAGTRVCGGRPPCLARKYCGRVSAPHNGSTSPLPPYSEAFPAQYATITIAHLAIAARRAWLRSAALADRPRPVPPRPLPLGVAAATPEKVRSTDAEPRGLDPAVRQGAGARG